MGKINDIKGKKYKKIIKKSKNNSKASEETDKTSSSSKLSPPLQFAQGFMLQYSSKKMTRVTINSLLIDEHFHLFPIQKIQIKDLIPASSNPFIKRLFEASPDLYDQIFDQGFCFDTLDIFSSLFKSRVLVISESKTQAPDYLNCVHHYTIHPCHILDRLKPFTWDNQLSEYEQYYLLEQNKTKQDRYILQKETDCYILLSKQ